MKENAMLEWEEKIKLLDISDEHTTHTTPFTPIAADHLTDITETGAIWKNFMIAARINQNNGGSLLLNLPTESTWWSTRCMKKAQEE